MAWCAWSFRYPHADPLNPNGATCYLFSLTRATWSDASLYCQFMCVLHCLITYVGISQLNCLEEVITWTKMIGFKFNVQ